MAKYVKILCQKCGKLTSTGYRSSGYDYVCKKCYKELGVGWLDSVIKIDRL